MIYFGQVEGEMYDVRALPLPATCSVVLMRDQSFPLTKTAYLST